MWRSLSTATGVYAAAACPSSVRSLLPVPTACGHRFTWGVPFTCIFSHTPSLPTSPLICRLKRSQSTVVANASSTRATSSIVDAEVQKYWETVLKGVDKPTAKRLLDFIDPSVPLGLRFDASKGSRPPVYAYFLQVKRLHPKKVVLVRVGEFFETVGIDAVLLVQHCGLNPMGREGNPPRAGCPRVNLRRTVADLVENAGLSVVVCEEAGEDYSYGMQRKQPKQRFIAAVVTPATPHYLHGLVDEDADLALEGAPPLVGIVPTVGGFSLIEVDAELQTVRVTEGLTEDAVYARLYRGGLAPPLFLHTPLAGATTDRRLSQAVTEVERIERMRSVFKVQGGAVERYNDPNPVAGMLQRIRLLLNLPMNTPFTELPAATPQTCPRPLYYSTAVNLGLHKTIGVPSLINYAIGDSSSLAARSWLRKLLLRPPPPSVGHAIHAACRALSAVDAPIPTFPSMSPANVVVKIRDKEANDTFFRELRELVASVGLACRTTALAEISYSVLTAVMAETGVEQTLETLDRACTQALDAIHEVVLHDAELGVGSGLSVAVAAAEEAESMDTGMYEQQFSAGIGATRRLSAVPSIDSVLARMIAINEDYVGKVRAERLPHIMANVQAAKERLIAEANRIYLVIMQAQTSSSGRTAMNKQSLYYNANDNAVWLKIPRSSLAANDIRNFGLIHPRDRFGKTEVGAYSTESLETAQDDYRRACAEARVAVRKELQALSERLQPLLQPLVAAATFAVVASALNGHVTEAARRGWSFPKLSYNTEGKYVDGVGDGSEASLNIQSMWPYWVEQEPVKNSFRLEGMFLLTGPNMAGKSTVLRSTAAVALLGACGLAVPAAPSTTIPYIDAFMLRNFSADSPLEGRSAFAVEMTEMRYVLQDVTRNSLVLLDELGKGTEVKAGAALAGAMLEKLDSIHCKGIFATHLHVLLDMDLRLRSTTDMRMEVKPLRTFGEFDEKTPQHFSETAGSATEQQQQQQQACRLVPTWRIAPGISTESLALEVAQDCQLPLELIARARVLYESASDIGMVDRDGDCKREGTDDVADVAIIKNGNPVTQADGDAKAVMTLAEAAIVLKSTAEATLGKLVAGSNDANDASANDAGSACVDVDVRYIPAGHDPPSRTVGVACVYVCRRSSDGWFYVGATDSLQQRVQTHRRKSKRSRVGDPNSEFLYVEIPSNLGAGSAARAVETAVIQQMQAREFGLLSDTDGRRKQTPRRGSAKMSSFIRVLEGNK